MPAPDEFDLDPVDEEDWDSDSYDDLMDTEGVPYDEVFAAGPRGAREAVLRETIPEPDEVRDRYWDALDDMLADEQERLEKGEYTFEEYLRNHADPKTKAALIAAAGVDGLATLVEDAEDEENSAATSAILRALGVGGGKGLKRRYRSFVKDETVRYEQAREHLAEYRPDNA